MFVEDFNKIKHIKGLKSCFRRVDVMFQYSLDNANVKISSLRITRDVLDMCEVVQFVHKFWCMTLADYRLQNF